MLAPLVMRETPCSPSVGTLPKAGNFCSTAEVVHPSILIAEDDTMLRRLFTLTLERYGYTVVPVSNGAEATYNFSQQHFDLVLLDVMMPVMDGLAACAQIRSRSTVPIIVLTAFSSGDIKVKAYRCGASLFVTKPIRPVELKEQIQSLLPAYLRNVLSD
jgi:DNA-binding response OmpR family regulator